MDWESPKGTVFVTCMLAVGGPQEGHRFLAQTTECEYYTLNNTLVTVNVSGGSFSYFDLMNATAKPAVSTLTACRSEWEDGEG